MDSYINLGIIQVATAYLFIMIIFIILKARKIAKSKELLVASIRMTLQLILLGYILTYIFESNYWLLSIAALVIMEIFAIFNIFKRLDKRINNHLKRTIVGSFILGTMFSFSLFILLVIRLSPWYEPTYFIPIAGMFIGNSMTGITLGISHLIKNVQTQGHYIENALMLGAEPKEACREIVNDSFYAAILPTINSMVGMGIIFIPGMMTGQILSGILPLSAIRYQIVIMLGILSGVTLSTFLSVIFGYRTFFNEEKQIIR